MVPIRKLGEHGRGGGNHALHKVCEDIHEEVSDGQRRSWRCRSEFRKRERSTCRDLEVIGIEMETEVLKVRGTTLGECAAQEQEASRTT